MSTSTTPSAARTPRRSARTLRAAVTLAVAGALALAGCGSDSARDSGDDVAGTYVHVEEGTIVLEADGDGTLTQSGDPVPFTYEVDGDTLLLKIDGEVKAEAATTGGDLTFRAGDFSGDEPVTFTRA